MRILGRKKVVGNPLLYGTTKQFLVHFGLNKLEDLPSIEEFDQFVGALDEPREPAEMEPLPEAEAEAEGELETDLEPVPDEG